MIKITAGLIGLIAFSGAAMADDLDQALDALSRSIERSSMQSQIDSMRDEMATREIMENNRRAEEARQAEQDQMERQFAIENARDAEERAEMFDGPRSVAVYGASGNTMSGQYDGEGSVRLDSR
jgi:hypothetical protein